LRLLNVQKSTTDLDVVHFAIVYLNRVKRLPPPD